MSLGRGMIYNKSSKQKLNSKISTKVELVAASEVLPQIIWTIYFLVEQKYDVQENELFQDNKNSIGMERNDIAPRGQRTHNINIRHFFIKDRVENGEITLIHCPTGDVIGDLFTKPLQGIKFYKFRDMIMGRKRGKELVMKQGVYWKCICIRNRTDALINSASCTSS